MAEGAVQPDVFHGSATYPRPSPGPVLTIGNFDGVHLGHRVLLDRVVARARAASRPSCVYTFHPAPRDVLRPGNPIPRIQILEDKIACLQHVGIDHVVVEPFDLALAARSPRWFADEILVNRLGASALVLGYDFRFGKARAGTVDDLRAWLDIDVEQVGAHALAGAVVSSSRIREAVRAGDVSEAAALLGRPHEVIGAVVRGDARGRELGYPTANVEPQTALVPGIGVYAVEVALDGGWRPAVASIGTRPTFGAGEVRIEVHVLDWSGDLYGQALRTRFVARLRDEVALSGPDELMRWIADDIRRAREVFGAAG